MWFGLVNLLSPKQTSTGNLDCLPLVRHIYSFSVYITYILYIYYIFSSDNNIQLDMN